MDTKRLITAVALSVVVLFGWQMYFAPKPAPEGETTAEETAEESDADPSAEAKGDGADGDGDGGEAPKEGDGGEAPKEPREVVEPQRSELSTEHFTLGLTNIGGRALNYTLVTPARYQDRGDILAPLVEDEAGQASTMLPFGTHLVSLGLKEDTPFEVVEESATAVTYRWESVDKKAVVTKRYSIDDADGDYGVRLDISVENTSGAALESTLTLLLHGRMSADDEPGLFSQGRPVSSSCMYGEDDDIEHLDSTDDPERFENEVDWIAVGEPYFVLVAATDSPAAACKIGSTGEREVQAELFDSISVAAGETQTTTFHLFLGPKESETMASFGRGIERSVDYGWFEFLARPIRWIMLQLYNLVGNWGLAIILLTMLIRGALWPITQKSQDSMMRMREISPQLKELQEKYKNDPMLMQQKQMELFRENNVSPFGCLPLFLQIPIWFALYRTIYVTAELYNAPFFGWIQDLSSADPYYVLPVAAGGLFLLQQLLMPNAGTDMRQKILMRMLPMVFVVVMLFLPAGLNLYILVSSMVGMIQTLYSRKKQERAKAAKGGGGDDIEVEVPTSGKAGRAERRRRQRQQESS